MTQNVERLAGALVMVDLPGPTLDPETAAHLRHYGVQAVCLFGKNIQDASQLAQLCRDLKEVLGPDALIALDHEGGSVLRTPFWPAPPSAMNLGSSDDLTLTADVSEALARQLRSVGINWNFAPVMDVNINPHNPVIGTRSFSDDPDVVTRHALAAVQAHLQARVAACVKHFPGHGDTRQDSHYTLPVVERPLERLEQVEFAPFRAAVAAQVPAFMTAHIVYPALDKERPATLSPAILGGLLRRHWGYDGVIITDSMGMRAIDDNYGRGEAGVLSLQAGTDMVMALGRREAQVETLEAIAAALRDGRLDRAAMQASAARLQRLAQTFPAVADAQAIRPDDAALFEQAWARGLRGWRQPQAPAPGSRVTLVAQREPERETVTEAGVRASALGQLLERLYTLDIHAYDHAAQLDWTQLRAAGQLLLLATTSRQRPTDLTGAQPDLHLALSNPYAVQDIDAPAVVTYGDRPEALEALAGWLRGDVVARPL
ncbi:beta-N-acetylhexosaminidase [Deinococcus sonorensis]|uniref:Beta-N-acetylhexosaminidase n=2 Tax=Deinococcus sonorensis TaxID=309891 RepID=A0AAU7UFV2_9DEIO